jgi:hypothetical protein
VCFFYTTESTKKKKMPIQTDVPANLYFSDDEHFNKKLQTGASATTLFKDAMSQHRHQQHEYLFQQKQQQQMKQQQEASRNSPTLTTDNQQSRRDSIGSPLLQSSTSARGAAAFLNKNENNNNKNNSNTSRSGTAQSGATRPSTSSRAAAELGTAGNNNNNASSGSILLPTGGSKNQHLADFPNIQMDDPLYSSTIMMLKRTRNEIQQLASELSASNMINDLPASEDVRRIVAKIFADPKNAETISESEWKRREQSYVTQRDKMAEKINDHLQQEKAALQEEIKRLGMD